MTTYTGVADANGDFTIPFSSNYTSGQKITVTAEKDSAVKTIELHAPSDTTGGGVIQFSGTLINFPDNIGSISLREIGGDINNAVFESSSTNSLFGKATGLDMLNTTIEYVGRAAFSNWKSATFLILPLTLTYIDAYGFNGWNKLQELIIPDSCTYVGESAFDGASAMTKLEIGSAVAGIGDYGFSSVGALTEMTVKPLIPPTIGPYTFRFLNPACVIKVPAAALATYQSASRWSNYSSQMIGI